ncbi:MAG: ADP-ribosylglycohydrolase family protein [Anaerolineae bacterium]|nr:ADP-ribosylglycohydrolase family protein [Anaerolineae bacterium]
MSTLPADYSTRVYAGWLGKCIGVRFGAPLEGWTYEEIRDNLGALDGYLNEAPGKLFKPDDDTALPMILIRALEDYGASPALSAAQIGQTWLNYLGDQQGTLWWGGYGISTEHTAYLNLTHGVPAPQSGSIALNGAALAEQIGGQIFSDIWGLVAPNNPALAADLAERAASVSHDGNGIYGGRFIAALVSLAFSESDPLALIEGGLAFVPEGSEYSRVIRAMQDFHRANPADWHAAFAHLKAEFGYDRYPGMVHIIPNAGVVALALLYGAGDFSQTIQIANMAGWDTDCNVGNVGAIMGVAVGLPGIEWRWREPMNDLLIAASIIGTRNILTIPQCADLFCRLGRQIAGETPEPAPRYHFRYPGSTSNFQAEGGRGRVIELRQSTRVDAAGTLQASIRKLNKKGEIRLFTRTYYRPAELSGNYYGATFTPLIHPGQTITAEVVVPEDAPDTLQASLYVFDDHTGQYHQAPGTALPPGTWQALAYTIPPLEGACLSQVGIVVRNLGANWETGALYVRSLDWSGPPDYRVDFSRERAEGSAISQWTKWRGYWRLEADRHYHGSGPGLCETYTGDIAWDDYRLEVTLAPEFGEYHNVNVRVQGALRSYAAGLAPEGRFALYRKEGLAYREVVSTPFDWQIGERYTVTVEARGPALHSTVRGEDRSAICSWQDPAPYRTGQIGLSCWHNSHTRYEALRVCPPDAAQE